MIGRINIDDFFKKQPNTETRFCDLCLVINKLADNLNHIEQEMWTDEKKFFELSDLVVANGNKIAELQEQVAEHDKEIDDCARDMSKQQQILDAYTKRFRELDDESMRKTTKITQNSTNNSENVHLFQGNEQEPVCFVSTTYLSDNRTTVFCGQKGASVEFNQPLPAGFIITIKEN